MLLVCNVCRKVYNVNINMWALLFPIMKTVHAHSSYSNNAGMYKVENKRPFPLNPRFPLGVCTCACTPQKILQRTWNTTSCTEVPLDVWFAPGGGMCAVWLLEGCSCICDQRNHMSSVLCKHLPGERTWNPKLEPMVSDFRLWGFFPLRRTGKVLSVCCFKINIISMFFRKESLSSRNTYWDIFGWQSISDLL